MVSSHLTLRLKTEKVWPQALHTRLWVPEAVGGYVEYPALGAKRKGPAPAPKPGCWPLTAPVPMTSFSRPQHEAHMDEAPAWRTQNKNRHVFGGACVFEFFRAPLKGRFLRSKNSSTIWNINRPICGVLNVTGTNDCTKIEYLLKKGWHFPSAEVKYIQKICNI